MGFMSYLNRAADAATVLSLLSDLPPGAYAFAAGFLLAVVVLGRDKPAR